MNWKIKQHLQTILQGETGYKIFPVGTRLSIALSYPNYYNVGMSNLGFHIIYEQINKRSDTCAERFFYPDKELSHLYEKSHMALSSLESQRALLDFPIIAFAISFELDYFHVLEMLKLGHVPVLASERGENYPLVIAGGPCSTFNPEPLTPFIDAFIIGEGEETINSLLDAYQMALQKSLSRTELLLSLAQIPGIYVPRFYEHTYAPDGLLQKITPHPNVPTRIKRQWVQDLDFFPSHTVITSENTEFNFYLLETARGCGRHCRFCMAGYCFRKPRNRQLETLKSCIDNVPTGKKIGLMGAAISDYPEIDALCEYIQEKGHPLSVASFRADSVTQKLVDALARSGQKTLTLAPEAGSEKMRNVINKGITDDDMFKAISMGKKAGIQNFRLYIMVGLPYENEEDIEAIVQMAIKLREYMNSLGAKGRLTLSINPFIAKPFTPFQWLPMADLKATEQAIKYIKKSLQKIPNVYVLFESTRETYIQGILARGDRQIGSVLYKAFLDGGARAFRRTLKKSGLNGDDYLYRKRNLQEILPWSVLDMGVKDSYFIRELEMAEKQKRTIPCFPNCKRCGVC